MRSCAGRWLRRSRGSDRAPPFAAYNNSLAYRCDPNVPISGIDLNVLRCPATAGSWAFTKPSRPGRGLANDVWTDRPVVLRAGHER